MSNLPYPFPISPEIVEKDYEGFNITALANPVFHGQKISSAELPNLELDFVESDGDLVRIRFRVDLKPIDPPRRGSSGVFNFDDKVMSFVMDVAQKQGFSLPHANSKEGKGNKTALKNLRHSLFFPWAQQQNVMDALESNRILRTQLPTTRFTAWNHKPHNLETLKQRYVSGIYGQFRLGTQIGFFLIEPVLGSMWSAPEGPMKRRELMINDQHRLLEQHRMHLLRCWPFLTELGLEMELFDGQISNMYELNEYVEFVYFKEAVLGGNLDKVINRKPTVRPAWGGPPMERWENMTVHAIMAHFMADGLEVPRFLALMARHKVPFTATLEVDVMVGGSAGIFIGNKSDPLMTLHKPSRPQENTDV